MSFIRCFKPKQVFFICTIFIIVLVLPADGFHQVKKQTVKAIKMKPDLVPHNVSVARIRFLPSGENVVRVTVSVRNASTFKTCDGPFKIKLEKREVVFGRKTLFTRLGEAGVTQVCADPASAKVPVESRTFEDTVPVGKTHLYRATVDSMNQVDEANEGNNTMLSEEYRWVAECTGVDLKMEWVDVMVNDRGQIYLKAHGRNRCGGSCSNNVRFEFDNTATSDPYVLQDSSLSVEPFHEYESSGYIGVRYFEGVDNTYSVRILAVGYGGESDTSNNECMVTVRNGERGTRRVTCR